MADANETEIIRSKALEHIVHGSIGVGDSQDPVAPLDLLEDEFDECRGLAGAGRSVDEEHFSPESFGQRLFLGVIEASDWRKIDILRLFWFF